MLQAFLDFPAPGVAEQSTASLTSIAGVDFGSVRLFLAQVAFAALEGADLDSEEARQRTVDVPLPVHARTFLNKLQGFEDSDSLVRDLESILSKVPLVSKRRRVTTCQG